MLFIGADIGRRNVKVSTSTGYRTSFPSVVGEFQELKLTNHYSEHSVCINGHRYFVGDLAQRESYTASGNATRSKIHHETKILFLTALGLIRPEEPFRIITGVPVYQFNKETKEELERLLCDLHQIQVPHTAERHPVRVKELMLVPEGAGAFQSMILDDQGEANNEHELMQRRVLSVDLGSRTTNVLGFDNGSLVQRFSTTLDFGCMRIEENNVPHGDFVRMVKGQVAAHLQNDLRTNDLWLLSGGGAILLADEFRSAGLKVKVVDDPLMANAIGYYRMGARSARVTAAVNS